MTNKIQFNPAVHWKIQTRLKFGGRDRWAELNQCQLASIGKKISADKNSQSMDVIALALMRIQALEFSEIFFRKKNEEYLAVCHVNSRADLNFLIKISQEIGWEFTMCPNPKAGWHHPNKFMCVTLSHPDTWIEWLEEQYPDVIIDEGDSYD